MSVSDIITIVCTIVSIMCTAGNIKIYKKNVKINENYKNNTQISGKKGKNIIGNNNNVR